MTTERDLLRESIGWIEAILDNEHTEGAARAFVEKGNALLAAEPSGVDLPALPEPSFTAYQTDATMRSIECRGYHGSDMVAYARAAIASRDAALAHSDKRLGEVIDERDAFEDALSKAYSVVVGWPAEWSNVFGIAEALGEIESVLVQAVASRDARIAELERGHCRANRDYCESMEALAVNRLTQLQEANTTIAELRAQVEGDMTIADLKAPLRAQLATAKAAFKNFHRSLCARFDYAHDPVDWERDQCSLEEHIAKKLTDAEYITMCTQRDREAAEAQVAALTEALSELVYLKDLKERLAALHKMGHGTDYTTYNQRQPIAWQTARSLLAARKEQP